MLNKIIIAAPFGNYLSFSGCTSTYGTFTWKPRSGRLLQILKTVRYNWRQQSWINKIGLRNPGIMSVQEPVDGIISIHGFNTVEWLCLIQYLTGKKLSQYVEFNLSCPNVGHIPDVDDVTPAIQYCIKNKLTPICKLPPIRWMDYVRPLYALGVRWFHCCNTIPTPGGGISGKPLKQYSLWACEQIRLTYTPDVKIIGGGGITSKQDIEDYRKAGADYFAIGSYCFNPLNWKRIRKLIKDLDYEEAN